MEKTIKGILQQCAELRGTGSLPLMRSFQEFEHFVMSVLFADELHAFGPEETLQNEYYQLVMKDSDGVDMGLIKAFQMHCEREYGTE